MADIVQAQDNKPDVLSEARPKYIAQRWFALTNMFPKEKGKQRQWLEWDRVPATVEELASVIGVAPATIYGWKRERSFRSAITQIEEEARRDYLVSEIDAIDRVMVQEALSGNHNAMKLFYQQQAKVRKLEESEHADNPEDSKVQVQVLIQNISRASDALQKVKNKWDDDGLE